ncbi:MAG: cadherin-like beta sandwich domain-containing protein [Lachnospiraceae bacterium]|nr:cadherin-like beta sandwich domain-containing protein [Lachnospiraceae bacterium]
MRILKINKNMFLTLVLAVCLLLGGMKARADSLSADNSLSSLGITTEGATVSPEFAYGTTVYDVTVPAGTTYLSLDPTPSNSAAYIDSITGQELTDGAATVSIVVVAENGDAYTYYLYVTAEEGEAAAETETEVQTEAQTETEAETEDSRYVSVARETLENAENTIATLKSETSSYRDRVNLLMKILYGMIGLCVVLLFTVINLLLKNSDRKSELNAYREMGYSLEQEEREPDRAAKKSEKKKSEKKQKKKKAAKPVIVETGPRQSSKEREDVSSRAYSERKQDAYSEMDEFDRTGRDTFYEKEPTADARMTDDPATVPKPARAKKQMKQMPEYELPGEAARYEPRKKPPVDGSEDDGEVGIDFIDL